VTLLACWLLFPLLLAALTVGCGLTAERLARLTLPQPLLPPLGLAVIIVVGQFAVLSGATAELAAPLIVAVAVVGFAAVVLFASRFDAPDVWAVAAAVGAFAAYAAPVVLSGEATFAGYIKLDDTSTFLALTDRAMEHGRSLDGLSPSSYEATLDANLPYYPLGSLLPLGIAGEAMPQDLAWLFQPYLAFLAALLALVLYHLAGLVVESRPMRAGVAIVAAQPALLYGFAHWGGVKELAGAPLIGLTAALTGIALRSDERLAPLVLLMAASAALVAVLSLGGAAWLLPLAIAVVVPIVRRRQLWRLAVAGTAFAALLAPSLAVAGIFLQRDTIAPLHQDAELGNLIAPLSPLQLFGIWPVGDFRLRPTEIEPVYLLVALVALAAAVAVALALARRAWGLVLYVASAAGAALAFELLGSPWVAAKALAMGAPALVLAALLACAALFTAGRRVEAGVAALAIAGGVVWSNVLAYREVNLAPRDQLAELESIGDRFAGQGPTLMTEYQPYGVRHFLRNADAEGASELRRRLVPLRDGSSLEKGGFADLDAFQLDAVLTYRTLVLRRSPLSSRPPSPYRLVWARSFYEVWQRPEPHERVAAHLSLGERESTAARPECGAIGSLAASGRKVIASTPRYAAVARLSSGDRPIDWLAEPNDPRVVYPKQSGELTTQVHLRSDARYEVWVGGSFRGRLSVFVDGRKVGARRHQLNWGTVYFTPFGEVRLGAGLHTVRLRYEHGAGPGAHGPPWPVGPFVLSPVDDRARISQVSASQAARLCGKTLDWVEAIA
jgi:hypothetical protein